MFTNSRTKSGWRKPTASYLSITYGPRDVPVRLLAVEGLLHVGSRFNWPTAGCEANRTQPRLQVVN